MSFSRASLASLPSLPPRPSTAGPAIRRESRLLIPRQRPSGELNEVYDLEDETRHDFVAQSRHLHRCATASSMQVLHAARRTRAIAQKAERDEETGRDIKQKVAGIPKASDDEVVALSKRLNIAMCHIFVEARSQSCYFKLFRELDRDSSGLISYYEFKKMIRDVLKVPPSRMDDHEIDAMWRWVDWDTSGNIASGEFLRLMRCGWPAFVEEQRRLASIPRKHWPKAAALVLSRPNWNFASNCAGGAWPEVTTTLEEKRRFYVEVASRAAMDKARYYHQQARQFRAHEARWQDKAACSAHELAVASGEVPAVPATAEGAAAAPQQKAMGRVASAPVL